VATIGGQATSAPTYIIDSTMKTRLADLSPTLTTATYSYAGGPGATTGAGAAATINALSVGVNFSSQSITSYQLSASGGGATWTAGLNSSAPHSFTDFTGPGGIRLTGSCLGCAGSNPNGSAASGTAHGAFVGGSMAPGMITSFGLSASGKSLAGAALLAR
jgi:hypothetical protein